MRYPAARQGRSTYYRAGARVVLWRELFSSKGIKDEDKRHCIGFSASALCGGPKCRVHATLVLSIGHSGKVRPALTIRIV